MKKLQLLMIFLVLSILIAGCTRGPIDIQATNVGKLILNQDQINTVEVIEGPTDANKVTLSDSNDVSKLINMINEIPATRLTKQEDLDFMPGRIQEPHFSVVFEGYTNQSRSLQGAFFIWPEGYIYAVDVASMTGKQRTIPYLSESKYPEIYQWLIDKTKQP
jgi:hypothetical protein